LKYSVVILLFIALIAQTFSRSLVLADYMVNLDAYKKACVNKAKPKMHCNGKCQMLKKMNKNPDDNGSGTTAPKYNQPDFVLSSKSFFPFILFPIASKINHFTCYISPVSSCQIGSIFHPPGA